MNTETVERMLAWFLHRAARDQHDAKHHDVVIALAHYANGTALARDYRAMREYDH